MKQEIIDLQPELIKSSKETEELQVLVEADAEKANAKRVNLSQILFLITFLVNFDSFPIIFVIKSKAFDGLFS